LDHDVRKPSDVHGRPYELVRIVGLRRAVLSSKTFSGAPAGGCCSAHSNYLRYGAKNTTNCYDTFVAAIKPYGMDSRDIPSNLNFFMYVPVREDGSSEILEGRSVPGDYVEVQADRDVLVAISNCAQIFNPCNGWNPTPVRLIRWRQA
jgi:uncharacterized protein YcgI (DUF1989 family)